VLLGAVLLFGQVAVASAGTPAELCASRTPGASLEAFVAIAARRVGDTTVRAAVCVVPAKASATKIGSYHAELHFDSMAVAKTLVRRPEGGIRVENIMAGQVKFAGAAPGGFPGNTLLHVEVRLKNPSGRPAFRLKMIELNSTDGTNLMKQLVVAQ
jgi:hypothetical protein